MPTHMCGMSLTWLFDLTKTSIKSIVLQTHLNQAIIALDTASAFQSLNLLPYTGLLGTWLTLTVHHSLQNFPVLQRLQLLKKANKYSEFLRTVQDKHATYWNYYGTITTSTTSTTSTITTVVGIT